jgi:hypothetical protein
MSGRRMEALLYALALAAALLGVLRWRGAEPVAAPAPDALAAAPAEPPRVPPERLAEAARAVTGGNPFRLERAPAPIGFAQPAADPFAAAGAMTAYESPPPPRPPLAVSGIVGPPWQAVLEGVPGREGGVLVRRGDVLGDLRIRDVSQTEVVVSAPDTTWRLSVRKPWQ